MRRPKSFIAFWRLEPSQFGKHIKTFSLYTSIDTFGPQAEYLRYGLNYKNFIKNVEYVLERLPQIQIIFMCTFNALSVVGFNSLLDEIVRLK